MVNPLDQEAVNILSSTIGMKIRPVVGVYKNLRELLARFYPEPKVQFDPSATIAVEREPFEYGDDTMLRLHSRQFAFDQANESLGSDTRVIPPEPQQQSSDLGPRSSVLAAPNRGPRTEEGLSQLDRIERAVEALQKRLDAIDATLARVLSRK